MTVLSKKHRLWNYKRTRVYEFMSDYVIKDEDHTVYEVCAHIETNKQTNRRCSEDAKM